MEILDNAGLDKNPTSASVLRYVHHLSGKRTKEKFIKPNSLFDEVSIMLKLI